MSPQTQLMLVRCGGGVLMIGVIACCDKLGLSGAASASIGGIVSLITGWLGADSPIKKAQREAESMAPPSGVQS